MISTFLSNKNNQNHAKIDFKSKSKLLIGKLFEITIQKFNFKSYPRHVIDGGWQVTVCDPIWHVISRSGIVTLNYALLYECLLCSWLR